jgi:hypothetical protein
MKSLVKVSFRNGAIAGALGAILVIGLYYLERHPFLIPVYLDFRIFLFSVFIIFTLKEIRDSKDGILYFWEGVIASLIFVSVYGVLASAIIGIFAAVEPSFLGNYISLMLQQLKALPADLVEKMGKQVYQRNVESLPSTNIFDLVSLYFWQSLVIGLFLSIVISVILRRQPKN